MSQPIIQVRNLSKVYQLGSIGASSLKDEFSRLLERWRGHRPETGGQGTVMSGQDRATSTPAPKGEFWALRDVSFDVQPGEIVGIIGRNGAGKSTLLKILSRITQQTTGEITLRGRVASLLEVGTGFHPDLTGRENIFLNGAILGMTRAEVRGKLDEIIAFSGVEKFIDTPVKRYSSGMYVRLGFAVAAHLEPEILIVDEVLAVGDAEFQRKCLGKMKDLSSKQGRTVLVVSHNVDSIARLCDRAILLHSGAIVADGEVHSAVRGYLNFQQRPPVHRKWSELDSSPGNECVRLRSIRVVNKDGKNCPVANITEPISIEIWYDALESGHILVPNFHLFNEDGTCMFVAQDLDPKWRHRAKMTGRYRTTLWIPGNLLSEGTIIVRLGITTFIPMRVHLDYPDVVSFQVVDAQDGSGARGDYHGHLPGVLRPLLQTATEDCGEVHQSLDECPKEAEASETILPSPRAE